MLDNVELNENAYRMAITRSSLKGFSHVIIIYIYLCRFWHIIRQNRREYEAAFHLFVSDRGWVDALSVWQVYILSAGVSGGIRVNRLHLGVFADLVHSKKEAARQ